MFLRTLTAAAGLLALSVLPAQAQTQAPADAPACTDITVSKAFVRATPGMVKNGAAFMTITGKTADRLVKADTPAADHGELHTHIMDEGVMRMRQIPAIDVPAGASVDLKPGGLHVMLIDLKQGLKQGDTVPLTLTFESCGTVSLVLPVMGPGAMMGHGH